MQKNKFISFLRFNLNKNSILSKYNDVKLYKVYMDKIKINPFKEKTDSNQITSMKKAYKLLRKLELTTKGV